MVERTPAKLADLECVTYGYGVVHHSCNTAVRAVSPYGGRKIVCDKCGYAWRMESLIKSGDAYVAERFWREQTKPNQDEHILVHVTEGKDRFTRCVTRAEAAKLHGTPAKPERMAPPW